MRLLLRLTWMEAKLFLREPLTVVFALALPLMILFILGGVFGNSPDPDAFRGLGPMDYYVPAYLALVAASVALISLPTQLAGNRERGVLKRLHASSVPVWAVFGSQILVSLALVTISAVLLLAAAALAYDISSPIRVGGVLWAFLVTGLSLASLGFLIGAVIPTARAAQALGVLLWFVMLFISGAGPPPEVLTAGMRRVAGATPLKYGIGLLQDEWSGLAFEPVNLAVLLGLLVVATALSLVAFRWE